MTRAFIDEMVKREYGERAGALLAKLNYLYPKLIDLSLGRLETLLTKLDQPHLKLPPVVHVAGTNGKGSTCANIRAILEAAGKRVHVMTSPHLISVTERFRVAGELVSEEELIETLKEVAHINNGAPITVFEVLTAAGFLLFSRHTADAAVLEVGLGGRFDATNVIPQPLSCAITHIALDHQAFLGATRGEIAREKAGIIKPRVPLVSVQQAQDAYHVIHSRCSALDAPLWSLGREVNVVLGIDDQLIYRDPKGELELPLPALLGCHQIENAALAVATLRASSLDLPDACWAGIQNTVWPARLQRLNGCLAQCLPADWEIWLDGGHNPDAGERLAQTLSTWNDLPLHLVIGMKESKDVSGFIAPLLPLAQQVHAVREPKQHMALSIDEIIAASGGRATPGPDVKSALRKLYGPRARVVICGSLYLAGVVLEQDANAAH